MGITAYATMLAVSANQAGLVLTTIYDPALLGGYYDNFQRFGHLDDVTVYVIPDRKTPPAVFERCRELTRSGLRTVCPTLEEQEQYLARLAVPSAIIPYNSDNRRNIGFLMAYESGARFLISIDDDNYCNRAEDFFGEHAVVCDPPAPRTVMESSTGYFNLCNLLEMETPGPVYPRGFPYARRHLEAHISLAEHAGPIAINAGLWTLDPDIDAISWLVLKPRVKAMRGPSVVLGPNTWSPVNTQNTALDRAAIPSYYFVRMGYPISGMPIDRYGDILSGYFAQACVKHLNGLVRAGTPSAEHRRNSHNYLRDAAAEWGCIAVLEDLLPWLTGAALQGSTYSETYRSLSYLMEDAVLQMEGPIWTDVTRAYFHHIAYHMRIWLRACDAIDGK